MNASTFLFNALFPTIRCAQLFAQSDHTHHILELHRQFVFHVDVSHSILAELRATAHLAAVAEQSQAVSLIMSTP